MNNNSDNPTRALNSHEISCFGEQYIKLYYRNAASLNDVLREEIDLRQELPPYDGALRFIQTDEFHTPFRIVYKTAGYFNRKALQVQPNYKVLLIDSVIAAVAAFCVVVALNNTILQAGYGFACAIAVAVGILYAMVMPAMKPYKYKTIPIITELMGLSFDARWLLVHDYVIEEPQLNRELRMFCANYGIGLCTVNQDGIIKVPITPFSDFRHKAPDAAAPKPLIPAANLGYTPPLFVATLVAGLVAAGTWLFNNAAPDFSEPRAYVTTTASVSYPQLQDILNLPAADLVERSHSYTDAAYVSIDDPRLLSMPNDTWALRLSNGQHHYINRPLFNSPYYLECFHYTDDLSRALDIAEKYSYTVPVLVILGPRIAPKSTKYIVAYGNGLQNGQEIEPIYKKILPPTQRILVDNVW